MSFLFFVLILCIELIWAAICRRCWMLARCRPFRPFCSPDLRRGFGSVSLTQDLGLTHDCVTYHLSRMRYHLKEAASPGFATTKYQRSLHLDGRLLMSTG